MTRRTAIRHDDMPLSWKMEAIADAVEMAAAIPFLLVGMVVAFILKAPWWFASAIARKAGG